MQKKLITKCIHCDSEIEVLPVDDDLTEFKTVLIKAGKKQEPLPDKPPKKKEGSWFDKMYGGESEGDNDE